MELRSFAVTLVCLVAGGFLLTRVASADELSPEKSLSKSFSKNFEETVANLDPLHGFLSLYLDPDQGRVWLSLPKAPVGSDVLAECLYVSGLTSGLGSNPVGLDRGRLGATRLIRFRRLSGKVLIEQANLSFRALSRDEREVRAANRAFATSVLWGGRIAARADDGRLLVDLTSFLVRDDLGIVRFLQGSGQGEFKLEIARSGVSPSACHVFPDNAELEVLLTFSGKTPGAHLRSTVPQPDSVSFALHHSFVRLPDDGYRPRRFDSRAGSFAIEFLDYAVPLDQSLVTRWIVRHRLEKVDPTAARSRAVEPIVYYVDPGVPEPVRSALIDGASWWNYAFEAAGFIDAFMVELLPDGVHPLDVRYNTIHWVHRSTRGWSYGGGVTDPRTGEMIKGNVLLGSLRVRQDRLLFEGLAGAEATGTGRPDDPVELALARIRQLAAHEVGHTLGFNHNFCASTYGGRASVMDYPAPIVGITQTRDLDFSDAYGIGVGIWDVFAVRYAYTQFGPAQPEEAGLTALIDEARSRGLLFLTDEDARPAGACHPLANLWDNGDDPVDGLRHALEVRKIALSKFGVRSLAPGQPLAELQEVLAPVYFHHRYQLEAAAKVIGGMEYEYSRKGDESPPATLVSGKRQREALSIVLDCLDPEVLDLREGILSHLLPRPSGASPNREMFATSTAMVFDALGAAESVADLAVGFVLQPERCARLVDFHRRDRTLPGLGEVLRSLVDRAFGENEGASARIQELRRTVQRVVLSRLVGLGLSESVPARVRVRVDAEIDSLWRRLRAAPNDSSQRSFLLAEIDRYRKRDRGEPSRRAEAADPPPGSPIGASSSSLMFRGGGCSFAPASTGK